MRGFSKAIITGNLTRDPELRTTPNGASVCSFSVAVNRVYKDANGEQKEDVSFIDCSAWNKLGEMINQYAKKGTGVLVSGRLDQRSFEGKDGVRRSRTEIVVEDFNFTGGPRNDNDSSSSNFSATNVIDDINAPEAAEATEEVDLSEIPF
ncbi:single-stranded DNA-binding protein [Candidatus Saccharibacteria bacterium]|nr:single-stranded DNA-binding protein [Candidatus Saccharibacteria bacterium]